MPIALLGRYELYTLGSDKMVTKKMEKVVRAAALGVFLTLPLSMVAVTAPLTYTTPTVAAVQYDNDEILAAVAAAEQAETEAVNAEKAIPAAKAKVKPALVKAQKTRKKVRAYQPKVLKSVKKVKKLKKAAKKNKAVKPKLAKARKTLKAKRAKIRTLRTTNGKRWDKWRANRDAYYTAVEYAPVAKETARATRETSDRMIATETVVSSATVNVLPQVSQPSANTGSASNAQYVVNVAAKPALPYIKVELQKQNGDEWNTVSNTETGRNGRVDVRVASNGIYRAVVNGKVSAAGTQTRELIFNDEFSTSTLDKRWVHRMQIYNPEGMRACSKGSPQAVTNNGGTVQLWVKKDTSRKANCDAFYNGKYYPNHSYRLNGHIGTQGTFSFTYGVAAARMKFQDAQHGQHGAFFLQPSSYKAGGFGPDYQGAEIDVIEFTGYNPKKGTGGLHAGIYANDANGNLVQKSSGLLPAEELDRLLADKDDKWFNRYHVFSVEWTPTEYVFRVDGVEFYRTSFGVSSRPQYPIVSLLSSDYAIAMAGDNGEKTLGSQKVDVDWVRVWQ